MENNESYMEARNRIRTVDVLVIDEIGMLSRTVFDMLESVSRKVRNRDTVFGGLQVIVAGSFKQLPPIPNPWQGDTGEFCFESPKILCNIPPSCASCRSAQTGRTGLN